MIIDPKPIETELQEVVGSIKLKVRICHNGCATSVRQTDNLIEVRFNDRKIRTQRQLDEQLASVGRLIS